MSSGTAYDEKAVSTNASASQSFSKRLQKLVTRFPVRDTRYLSGASFFIGACLFVANGFLYIFMVKEPHLTFNAAALPVTSMVGTTFFLVGCSTTILEAMNVVEQNLEGLGIVEEDLEPGQSQKVHEKAGVTQTSHLANPNDRQQDDNHLTRELSGLPAKSTILLGQPGFRWLPAAHHLKDMEFWAAIISWTGIIPFYISAIAYIPGVADLTNVNTYYYLALLPYCLGGVFFTIAAVIQTILVQRKWYLPALNNLVWYSRFLWSVGSFGFALGGSLWYAGEGQYWAATLASFWGSWLWVLGSALCCFTVVGEY